jgi:hypothetical protein
MIWVWRATVEWYWQGETEELGEKPVSVPLCPPQISHGLTRAQNPGLRGDRPATNHLSHGVTLPSEECVPWSDIQATGTSNILTHVLTSSSFIKTKFSQCHIILQSRKEQNGMTMEVWRCLVRHTGGCSCEAVPSDRPIPHIEYPVACLDGIQSRSTTREVVLWMQRRKGRRKIN